MPSRLLITLNARLRPLDRGEQYEDPLQDALDTHAPGCKVTGGGTMLTAEHEPSSSDIDLDLEGDPSAVLALVIAALEAQGAPKGSRARLDERPPVEFGVTEGLALYLNGTDLPDEVYTAADPNDLVTDLLDALGEEGEMQSYWEGPTETALYLYGPSAERMRTLIAPILADAPLAQLSRVVPLPLTLPN
ncbi:hypothetical protein [Dactylosporangium sp. CA-092794]|uniref:hypothetical protein n=1 Tax=Dactylosporangium sp. CA-092794 TaxID=3239929 RepID=UPI003D8C01C0